MVVTKFIELDYGHTLPQHSGFCNQIHGHRGKVVAHVKGSIVTKKGSSDEGMVADFKFIKQILMDKVHAVLDHGFAVWEKDTEDVAFTSDGVHPTLAGISTLEFITQRNKKVLITNTPPTAECLAKWAYKQCYEEIRKQDCVLESIEWFETPSSSAIYTFDNFNTEY